MRLSAREGGVSEEEKKKKKAAMKVKTWSVAREESRSRCHHGGN